MTENFWLFTKRFKHFVNMFARTVVLLFPIKAFSLAFHLRTQARGYTLQQEQEKKLPKTEWVISLGRELVSIW